MFENYSKALKIIKKYNQDHLLVNYGNMSDTEKEELIKDIMTTNFEELEELYKNIDNHFESKDVKIEPISFVDKEKLTKEELEKYGKIGEEIIKKGHYAVVTMAGGQRH